MIEANSFNSYKIIKSYFNGITLDTSSTTIYAYTSSNIILEEVHFESIKSHIFTPSIVLLEV